MFTLSKLNRTRLALHRTIGTLCKLDAGFDWVPNTVGVLGTWIVDDVWFPFLDIDDLHVVTCSCIRLSVDISVDSASGISSFKLLATFRNCGWLSECVDEIDQISVPVEVPVAFNGEDLRQRDFSSIALSTLPFVFLAWGRIDECRDKLIRGKKISMEDSLAFNVELFAAGIGLFRNGYKDSIVSTNEAIRPRNPLRFEVYEDEIRRAFKKRRRRCSKSHKDVLLDSFPKMHER